MGEPLNCTDVTATTRGRTFRATAGIPQGCTNSLRCNRRSELGVTGGDTYWVTYRIQLEERYRNLQKEYLERSIRQWGLMEASQIRGGCNNPDSQNRTPYESFIHRVSQETRGCQFPLIGGLVQRAVGSDHFREEFTKACNLANGRSLNPTTHEYEPNAALDYNQRVQDHARSILQSKCNIEYFEHRPFASSLAAQQNDRNTPGYSRQASSVAQFNRFLDQLRSQCGEIMAENAVRTVEVAENSSSQGARAELDRDLACQQQGSEPGLDQLSISELSALARENPDPMALRSLEARRSSNQVTSATIRAYDEIKHGIQGICSNDPNHENALNFGELESMVGAANPPDENLRAGFSQLASCSLESAEHGGVREGLHYLTRACDGLQFLAAFTIPPPARVALSASCLGVSALSANAEQNQLNRVLAIRRSLGSQMDCNAAEALSRRMGEASERLSESRLATLFSLGGTAHSLQAVLEARNARTARDIERILDEEISARRMGRTNNVDSQVQRAPSGTNPPSSAALRASHPDFPWGSLSAEDARPVERALARASGRPDSEAVVGQLRNAVNNYVRSQCGMH